MSTFTKREPMMVEGVACDWSAMDAAYLTVGEFFTASDLRIAMARRGIVPTDRAADRYMQAKKRAGAAKFSGGRWRKTP